MPEAEQMLPVDAVRAEAALLRSRLRDDGQVRDDALVSSAWEALRD